MLHKSAASVLFWLYMSRNVNDIKWVLILSESLKQNKHVFKFLCTSFHNLKSQQIQSLENWTKCIHGKNSIWFFSVFFITVYSLSKMFLFFLSDVNQKKGRWRVSGTKLVRKMY